MHIYLDYHVFFSLAFVVVSLSLGWALARFRAPERVREAQEPDLDFKLDPRYSEERRCRRSA